MGFASVDDRDFPRAIADHFPGDIADRLETIADPAFFSRIFFHKSPIVGVIDGSELAAAVLQPAKGLAMINPMRWVRKRRLRALLMTMGFANDDRAISSFRANQTPW